MGEQQSNRIEELVEQLENVTDQETEGMGPTAPVVASLEKVAAALIWLLFSPSQTRGCSGLLEGWKDGQLPASS